MFRFVLVKVSILLGTDISKNLEINVCNTVMALVSCGHNWVMALHIIICMEFNIVGKSNC